MGGPDFSFALIPAALANLIVGFGVNASVGRNSRSNF
jgi:hypothetical protein